MEGTVTGEHGVGLIKRDYLSHEMGQSTVDAMRKVTDKRLFRSIKALIDLDSPSSNGPLTLGVCSTVTKSSEPRSQAQETCSHGKENDVKAYR